MTARALAHLFIASIAFLSVVECAGAQSSQQWTFAGGLAVTSTQPRAHAGVGGGGLARADRRLWQSGNLSAGVGAHMAILPVDMGTSRICLATSCFDSSRPYMKYFGGVGLAAQFGRMRSAGWWPYGRAFAEPIWGRVSEDHGGRKTTSFVAPLGGAGIGIAKVRFRLDLEAGIAANVAGDHPRIWSLQVGFAR